MEQLRYGILSTSSIAPRFIAAVRAGRAGEILALSSRSEEKAREKATQWEIPRFYGSHDALLADPDVNTVYISTVNSHHYRWAMAALEAGKHVVCEKPMTTSAKETAALFAKAGEKGLFLMEAEKMLFLPAILEVKRRIDGGELGQMYMAELSHSFPASYNGWMFDEAAGGGPVLSSGIYAVQLLQFLFGSIKEIRGRKNALETGVEWQYILTGEMESGLLFSAKNSTRAILDNTARLFGTNGWVEIPEYWKARKAIFHFSGREPETVEFPCAHELVYEARHILECLQKGLRTSPVVTEKVSMQGIAAIEQVKAAW
jgi:predicted dehydrogenase